MLAIEQMKFIEYIVTGHTVPESAQEVGIAVSTARNWLKQPDVLQELSRATDIFAKEVLKARSRSYRVIQKKILDKIMEKIDNNELDNYSVNDLIKMLDKSVLTARNDEDPKKVPAVAIQQNTININGNLEQKFKDKEFISKFSELLIDMDPADIEDIAQAKEKADKQNAEVR
jgi:phage terminase small subunit